MAHLQIPAYSDRWMMGDRTGELVKVTKLAWEKIHESVRPRHHKAGDMIEIAHVKLDKSGKTGKFILNDCTL
jgi:hypothetical protein